MRSCPSAVSRITWNQPSASDRYSIEPSGNHRGADIVRCRAGHDLPFPRGHLDDRDLGGIGSSASPRLITAIRAPSGDHSNPRHRRSGPGRGAGRFRLVRRAPATRNRRIDDPHLAPARRREGTRSDDRRATTRLVAAARLATTRRARAVGFDDPDLFVPDERQAATVRRPLRVGDRLLGGRDLDRISATEPEREELPGPGRLRRVRDDAVARVEPEFAGASMATIASTVRLDDGVVGGVGIRPWSSRGEDLR